MASRASHTQPGRPWLPTTLVGKSFGSVSVMACVPFPDQAGFVATVWRRAVTASPPLFNSPGEVRGVLAVAGAAGAGPVPPWAVPRSGTARGSPPDPAGPRGSPSRSGRAAPVAAGAAAPVPLLVARWCREARRRSIRPVARSSHSPDGGVARVAGPPRRAAPPRGARGHRGEPGAPPQSGAALPWSA